MNSDQRIMPPKRGAASNYAYGRTVEKKVGRAIQAEVGGTYKRTPGSRSAVDVTNKAANGSYVLTQVKASRASAKSDPHVSAKEQKALKAAAREKSAQTGATVVAQTVLVKGGT